MTVPLTNNFKISNVCSFATNYQVTVLRDKWNINDDIKITYTNDIILKFFNVSKKNSRATKIP